VVLPELARDGSAGDIRLPHRRFRDLFGRDWQVWEVQPTAILGSARAASGDHNQKNDARGAIRGVFEKGWLAFQYDLERRRLAPIPENWVALDEGELRQLLDTATPAGKPRRLIE
jgi:hypothetical protein